MSGPRGGGGSEEVSSILATCMLGNAAFPVEVSLLEPPA